MPPQASFTTSPAFPRAGTPILFTDTSAGEPTSWAWDFGDGAGSTEVVESGIRIGAKAIWMQEGVVHPEAAERARHVGLAVMVDLCILKEHAKRFRLTGQ